MFLVCRTSALLSKRIPTRSLLRSGENLFITSRVFANHLDLAVRRRGFATKKATQSKNQDVLRASSTEGTRCPPPKEPPKEENNTTKYLIAAALAAGGAGLIYYFSRSGKEKSTSGKKAANRDARIPASSEDIPKEVPYLLVGGGTASFTAFRAIKSHEPKARVLVITIEPEIPYMRPPLSKELWFSAGSADVDQLKFRQWNGAERSVFYEPADFYVDPKKLMEMPNGGVAICRGYKVIRINVQNQTVELDDGTEIKYGKCLIATGVSPKNLKVFETAPATAKERLSFYKTIADFKALKKIVDRSKSIAIIGGGFLGSELACALAQYGAGNKLEVYQIFHEAGNMGKILPAYLSEWTTNRVREEGVNVINETQVKSVSIEDRKLALTLLDGKKILVDHAVVAVGSEPNVELAKSSNLEVDPQLGGFLVNSELAARTNLYVAGDAACFYDPKLGRRRVEHHDHAVVSGRLAGENMIGLNRPYSHQSMFWSDLGPRVGYEAIGLIDSSLPTVGVFAKWTPEDTPANANADEKLQANPAKKDETGETKASPEAIKSSSSPSAPEPVTKKQPPSNEENFGKGVVFYLRDDRVVGILLWNVFNRINIARKIIAQDTKYDNLNEVAKLFDIYDQQNPEQ